MGTGSRVVASKRFQNLRKSLESGVLLTTGQTVTWSAFYGSRATLSDLSAPNGLVESVSSILEIVSGARCSRFAGRHPCMLTTRTVCGILRLG